MSGTGTGWANSGSYYKEIAPQFPPEAPGFDTRGHYPICPGVYRPPRPGDQVLHFALEAEKSLHIFPAETGEYRYGKDFHLGSSLDGRRYDRLVSMHRGKCDAFAPELPDSKLDGLRDVVELQIEHYPVPAFGYPPNYGKPVCEK